ncbi:MAG: hypothetical protein PUB46_10515 [Lachnospiraceae bacterium]|uniref:hypothetical protein n=1 Tax=Roseburia hominis TaxID=301301 RepID=UPI001F44C9F3|nr:hypothetical protein [Roseburia hominis]MCI5713042.1 hypothetical protein [Lachnospiraceae bacterium]MDD6170479.1 hypothetical protein [Lachnospiraceae bacterium]MDY4838185.1 hypothetical protein [Lachnospiraceae bacterium]
MREKLRRFMTGRYGVDQLSRLYLVLTLVLLVLSMITKLPIFYGLAIILLIYMYYRMFSKNTTKMYAQNQKYLNMRYQIVVKWNNAKKHFAQRKEYRFYRCPKCHQKVRVPRGKGKICITCPKCRNEFIKKS